MLCPMFIVVDEKRLTHSQTMTPFDAPGKLAFCFDNFLPFSSNLKLSSANSFTLEESKISRLGKG